MIRDSIYEQVKKLTENDPRFRGITAWSVLYGYSKLLTMSAGVLNVLFEKEEDRLELAKLIRIMEDHQVDLGLLKQAAPLFLTDTNTEEETREIEKIETRYEDSQEKGIASQLLVDVLEMNLPQMELVKKGHSLEDVFTYLDQEGHHSKKEVKPAQKAELKADESSSETDMSSPEEETLQPVEQSVEETKKGSQDRFHILVRKTVQLYDRLILKVKGQNEAVRLFAQGYFQSEVLQSQEEDRKGPSATFFFAGPPGVGKTFLAETAAGLLNRPFLRLDMSEYAMSSAVQTLAGVPATYQKPKEGVLTGFVKKHPDAIILLDEIEKAHEDVKFEFLQVLDGGVLTDDFLEDQVDFKKTIMIFTTNAGKSLYEGRDRENLATLPRPVVIKAILEEKDAFGQELIPPALCSRFASGNLVMFNHLNVHTLINIIEDRFARLAADIENEYGFKVEIDNNLSSVLLFSQSTGLDARNMTAQSAFLLKNELYEFGRHVTNLSESLGKLEKIRFLVDASSEEVRDLFHNKDDVEILYIGDEEELKGIPFSGNCHVHTAGDFDRAKEVIGSEDIMFCLIDPLYGPGENASLFLSLDDRGTIGIAGFENLRESLPQMPVYFIEKEPIQNEDKALFLERGLRGFIRLSDPGLFADEIAQIAHMIYLQMKVNELSARGRVLAFNSAQRFCDDGKTAELIFYDFKTRLVADASENQMLLSDTERPETKFKDVIGAENAKSELEYFVRYLKNPRKYMVNNHKPPKGILLYGPPGTGKTMLARAMAGESDVPFFSTTATAFKDKLVGESERKIRQLFATAKKFAPSIIFIDEIDAIGKERTGSTVTQHTESMLNTLLTEIDGFESDISRPVFVIAATNYDLDGSVSGKAASMDPALIRRFDNRIYVDLPKESEREDYLKLERAKLDEHEITDQALKNIAKRTTGESLAELKNIFSLAVRNAQKAGSLPSDDFLLNALEEYLYGEKRDWDENYYRSVSIHESGHAYICSLSGEKPSYVTIVSRGNFGGYMQHANEENVPSYTKEQLLWKIRVALAGRAAELEFFGPSQGINTGISSDLTNATTIAFNMICRYAMDEDHLLSMSPEKIMASPRSEELFKKAEKILDEEMKKTRELIREGKDKVKALSDFLMKNNQATEEEIEKIFFEG